MDAVKTGAHFIRRSCARCIRKEIKDVILRLFNWMTRINSALDYHFSSSKVTKPPSYYHPSALKERLSPFLTVFAQINDSTPRVVLSLILFFSYDPSGSPISSRSAGSPIPTTPPAHNTPTPYPRRATPYLLKSLTQSVAPLFYPLIDESNFQSSISPPCI